MLAFAYEKFGRTINTVFPCQTLEELNDKNVLPLNVFKTICCKKNLTIEIRAVLTTPIIFVSFQFLDIFKCTSFCNRTQYSSRDKRFSLKEVEPI